MGFSLTIPGDPDFLLVRPTSFFLKLATVGTRNQTCYPNWLKGNAMRRFCCALALILAVAVPSVTFGGEPQDKEGTQTAKQQSLQSVQKIKNQKKKGIEISRCDSERGGADTVEIRARRTPYSPRHLSVFTNQTRQSSPKDRAADGQLY